MRGDEGFGVPEQRMIGGWGFFIENVGGVAANFIGIERCDHVGHVDEFGAGGVHDEQFGFAQSDARCVDEMSRGVAEICVQAEHIDLREHGFDFLVTRDTVLIGEGLRPVRVEAVDFHAECEGAFGDLLTDAPQSDNADALVPDFMAGDALPLSGANGVGGVNEIAHKCEQQTEGVLRDGGVVHAGSEKHGQLARGAFGDVDLVQPDAVFADDAEAWQ